ncbi:nitroreductase [Clostridium acetobutylicum]|uniref:Nitroreductase family protein n=1 Tax=Clostridium acetobutylicum (strain ATCC 824 / DSM 792 / JCM 1419 / IAM 19013 / LMG 5710 / NBRC 13948 / NRRL B-527 / VKM B-1787 / 2291 / W) TaxID=272562 RepID=Q97GQ5_CLOAB|nr:MULTISPECIES: nitroreductase family protein [Clostridium]AAK80267.1 Nitroreductase family protein [Clostridium acetobutylicum ATCC 824]ADZ21363.1 Nitroreductase family protein [Clostridium acetobutylicum EA 2018]AEI32272.1 nitroreductase family protein [Clostridium acetobutylicum DSM 1731]AWV79310.1 nitroreductase [Clostridium acetobutylicum]KHD38449.1 nitroreductase [Clostridium acetobutylicum]
MDFYQVIKTRTSTKKFKNTPIAAPKLDNMLNAAMMSPSWKNKTSYSFVIVDDERKKDAIANFIINSDEDAKNSVKDAPMVVAIVGDTTESGHINGKEYYLVDSAIAMEHFVLAAANEGYGTCWIASFDEKRMKDELRIPDKYSVVAITPVGEVGESKAHYEPKDIENHIYRNYWSMPYSEKKHLVMK